MTQLDNTNQAKPHLPLPVRQSESGRQGWLFGALLLGLVAASFLSLDLQWAQFLSRDAISRMGGFLAEFYPPELGITFLHKVAIGAWETLAMSALGTLLASLAGLALALSWAALDEWVASPLQQNGLELRNEAIAAGAQAVPS